MVTYARELERRWARHAEPTPIPSVAEFYGNNSQGQALFCTIDGNIVHLFMQQKDGSLDTWDGMWGDKPARFQAI